MRVDHPEHRQPVLLKASEGTQHSRDPGRLRIGFTMHQRRERRRVEQWHDRAPIRFPSHASSAARSVCGHQHVEKVSMQRFRTAVSGGWLPLAFSFIHPRGLKAKRKEAYCAMAAPSSSTALARSSSRQSVLVPNADMAATGSSKSPCLSLPSAGHAREGG